MFLVKCPRDPERVVSLTNAKCNNKCYSNSPEGEKLLNSICAACQGRQIVLKVSKET